MRSLCVILILVLFAPGCSSFRPGWVDESSWKVDKGSPILRDIPGLPGTFDEDGNYIPENSDIVWTYKIPDISAGFIFDIESAINNEWAGFASPSIQIELFEFDSHIPYINTLKIDFGVAYQRTFLYLGKLWTNIFEISTGVFGGWNYETRGFSYGVAGTIIKF